jgi:hypothetical protein
MKFRPKFGMQFSNGLILINESRCCESVRYHLLKSLCAVSFVRNFTVLKHSNNVSIFSTRQAKNTNSTSNNTVPFLCWQKLFCRYRGSLVCRTACGYLLFNLTQFNYCVLERSIKNVLMFNQSQCCLYSRTATSFGLNSPSVQRSHTI